MGTDGSWIKRLCHNYETPTRFTMSFRTEGEAISLIKRRSLRRPSGTGRTTRKARTFDNITPKEMEKE
ncbi:MAG: hypothetical protein SVY53_03655 [Chloroflexota bacterium]|nr:hypothetical protein [Chloroflexota bacterium]